MPLTSYAHFAAEDVLTRVVMERMLAGVATRRHARTAEPIGEQATGGAQKSTSRSAISRRFVKQTETALAELMARDLAGEAITVQIENGLHWVRDVTFAEDHSQVRTGAGPQVMASLRIL